MTHVYVGIGSNFEREKNIRYALACLHKTYMHLTISSVYKNKDIRCEGDDFYNLVAGFNTNADLVNLIKSFQNIEYRCGRVRNKKDSIYPLDIDLLLFGDLIYKKGKIQVPRAELIEHTFVLRPLAEIAGNEKHPEIGKRFKDLWDEFPKKDQHPLTLVQMRF